MSDELFNLFSAIGIGLTFLASVAAVIVSIASLKSSNKVAKRAGYLNTITPSRDKWSYALRESSSLYFTHVARICSGQEDNLVEIYNELTRYHFSIILLLFAQDKEIQENMITVRRKAHEIIVQNNIIVQRYTQVKDKGALGITEDVESDKVVIQARQEIADLRYSIIEDYQVRILDGIRTLLEKEWRKQQYEATDMWKRE